MVHSLVFSQIAGIMPKATKLVCGRTVLPTEPSKRGRRRVRVHDGKTEDIETPVLHFSSKISARREKREVPPQILVSTEDTVSVLRKCENSNSYSKESKR